MRSPATDSVGTLLSSRFASLKMPDQRLVDRLHRITERLEMHPAQSFPSIFQAQSELDGFYRFVNNKRVSSSQMILAACQQTIREIEPDKTVLAIHDTSIFSFAKGSQIQGLGRITNKQKGFFGHFCIAANLNREIVGLLGMHPWTRPEARIGYRSSRIRRADPTSETHKWINLIREVHAELGRNQKINVIHVADREADDYTNFCEYVAQGIRFVFRASFNRNIQDPRHSKLFDSLKQAQIRCEREVALTKRRPSKNANDHRTHPVRKARVARLGIASQTLQVFRGEKISKHLPKTLELNFVRVFELDPPAGEVPIEWTLITNEPIQTEQDLLKVVDIYRARWTIEEYFKALKTGCSFEKRGLESLDSLLTCLAIFAPIACQLYNLKVLGRDRPEQEARNLMSTTQVRILARITRKNEQELRTIRSLMWAIAMMGGHLKHNGPPGWQVLARGYEKLLQLEQGWIMAQSLEASPEPCDM
jgi:hypothetical protein